MKHRPLLLRYLWAVPCSLVGLLAGLALLAAGGSVRVHHGIIEFARHRCRAPRSYRFDAITFGHVVLGQTEATLDRARAHELVHVRQYECWGVFFFVAFPASSLMQLLRGRDPYWDNYFEVQARARCGQRRR